MTQITEIRGAVIELAETGLDGRERRTVIEGMNQYETPGQAAFWLLPGGRDEEARYDLPGWPKCACTACGCSEPATCTDDGGVEVCGACSDYAVDDDGEVHCSNCDDVEIITESCGAGNQTRSYARIKPPETPEADPEGEWACYWDTAGDDAHVVSRHTTRDEAEQAVASHDWPRPGDRTQYLCGFEIRQLVDDGWVTPSE